MFTYYGQPERNFTRYSFQGFPLQSLMQAVQPSHRFSTWSPEELKICHTMGQDFLFPVRIQVSVRIAQPSCDRCFRVLITSRYRFPACFFSITGVAK
jgi:hypothetical protein